MTTSSEPSPESKEPPGNTPSTWRVPVCHPNLYMWLVFVSALDVILTRVILFFGGTEVNPIADFVLDQWGRLGMSIFKFIIVGFVIIACEFISRRNRAASRRLAIASILISLVPVVWSCLIIISLITDPPLREDGEIDADGFEVRAIQPCNDLVDQSPQFDLVMLKETAWPVRPAS